MRIVQTHVHSGLHACTGVGLNAGPWVFGFAESFSGLAIMIGLLHIIVAILIRAAWTAWHAPPMHGAENEDAAHWLGKPA